MDDTQTRLLEAVQGILEQEPALTQLEALEPLRVPLLRLRTQLQQEVWQKREQYRMPNYPPDHKDKSSPKLTDFDRRTMLDASIAELQTKYELVRGLEDLVKERIQLILNVNQENS